jgi:signal transduction histidine kinase
MTFAFWQDRDLRRQWLLTLLAVLAVQAFYWTVLLPLFAPKPIPHERLDLIETAHAELASPDWQDVLKARFTPAELPWETCCHPGYHAIRTHFTLPAVPDEGLAIVPVVGSDNFSIRVNGSLVFGEGRMKLPDQTYHGSFRGTIRAPSGLLRAGRNEIVLTLVRGPGEPEFFVGKFAVGAYGPLKAHYDPREFMLNGYATISMTLAFMVAALAVFSWARGGWSPYLGWLAALALSWALSLLYFELADTPLRDKWRLTYMTVVSTFLPIAWLNLVNSWGGNQLRWLGRTSMLLFAACVAVFLIILWRELQEGIDTVYSLVTWFTALLSVGTVVLLLRKIPGLAPDRRWEFAIYVLVCILMIYDGLNVAFDFAPRLLMSTAVPILLAALAVAFLARNVRLFQSSEQINTMLQTQLNQRTAELEAAHVREKEFVRKEAHIDERQRIMRDMHDGLGSQLMSMLLAARRGVAKPATVAEGLQAVIDEMRLLIDSMDSVGESLGSAFATFRERVQVRVEEAGMAFEWSDTSAGKLPELGPREVLQVFRIMQEAVTNALKHSKGSVLRVAISPSNEPGLSVRIAVSDNGGGLGKANPRGRGMDSMAARATGIGGKLEVQSAPEGVQVLLDLPQR